MEKEPDLKDNLEVTMGAERGDNHGRLEVSGEIEHFFDHRGKRFGLFLDEGSSVSDELEGIVGIQGGRMDEGMEVERKELLKGTCLRF